MADEKISAMTFPGSWAPGAVFPFEFGGNNYAATRAQFLFAQGGDDINMGGGSSAVGLLAGTGPYVTIKGPDALIWTRLPDVILNVTSGGDFFIAAVPGQKLNLSGNGAGVNLDASGAIQITAAAGQTVTIGYTPGNSSDWSGDPTDYQSAVDRIAARLAALFGPIP